MYDWSPYAIGGATRPDSFTSMTPAMQAGLWSFLQAADSELGPGLQVYSGYRSPELQAQLYQNALQKYGSPEAARKWVAPPGRSRHNTGQAADLKWNGTRIDAAPEHIQAWIRNTAGQHGLAVPMSWEPWQVEIAGARGQAVPKMPSPEPVEQAPDLTGIMAALKDAESKEHETLGGIFKQMAEPEAAPVAPIMPRQVQPMQIVRRETSRPYLELFHRLMGA